MEANELKIGNLIGHQDYSEEYFRVMSIEYDSNLKSYAIDTVGGSKGGWVNDISLITPVLLTEEWLKKLEFERKIYPQSDSENIYPFTEEWLKKFDPAFTVCWEHKKQNLFEIQQTKLGFIYMPFKYSKVFKGEATIPRILHIHQLQNLFFTLTGEELTIIIY